VNQRAHASLLLIGNELLSGRVRDENGYYFAGELWRLGVPVRRAEFCPDDVTEIAAAVARLAPQDTWLFTAGGIGPTHDDVTIEGVARAFGVGVIVHPELERLVRAHFGGRLEPAHLRMAWTPEGAGLEGAGAGGWPTVRMRNVYILPGVPAILRRKFERLRERFRQPPLHRRSLAFQADEARLASLLARVAHAFPEVAIGSYPDLHGVLVTFEGADAGLVDRAVDEVERATDGIPRAGP
jgi:molybdopterin-biosynthesis enzyme MoeA-like protein